MRKVLRKDSDFVDVITVAARVINATVAVIRLIYDILRDSQQKSNRPDQG